MTYAFISILLFCANALAWANEEIKCQQLIYSKIEIVCLKYGTGPFSAEQRIEGVRSKLEELAKDMTFDADHIQVIKESNAYIIRAAEAVILHLHTEDLPASKQHHFANDVAAKMRKAIRSQRSQDGPKELWTAIGYTAGTTLTFILLLVLLSRGFVRIYNLINNGEGRFIKTVKINKYEILNSKRIVKVLLWIAQLCRIFLTITLFYMFLPLILSFFPYTANWTPKIYGLIWNPLNHVFHTVSAFIPNLFFIVTILVATHFVLKVIHFIFSEIEDGSLQIEGFYKDWASPTYKLVKILVFAFAVVMIFPYLPGSSSPAFQGVSVFLGVLFSLGSSSAVANIVAGIVLTYMRPFRIGDRVKISDTVGDVIEKNLLVTRLRTIKNVNITIPNSMVLGSHIINYSSTSKNEGLILNTTITIGYDVPWRQVHDLLLKAAQLTNDILPDKKPFILQTALNDFHVSYELNAYTDKPNSMAITYSNLHQNIQDVFNSAGVEIMSPHYSALRDGNETTIPVNERAPGYEAPKFRIQN